MIRMAWKEVLEQRPEADTSGPSLRTSRKETEPIRETYGSLETRSSQYPGFPLVSRAESRRVRRSFYERSNASIVMASFLFVEAVIGDNDTVAIDAARRPNGRATGRLKENTGAPKRGGKPIAGPKSVVEKEKTGKEKKPWMMTVLHHLCPLVICTRSYPGRSQDADFVVPVGSLLKPFPAGDTAVGPRRRWRHAGTACGWRCRIMLEQVELSSLDLRYQGYRMRNRHAEKTLLVSILEHGIRDPLEGVDTRDARVLLNGFKRYRCARKLDIGVVPYFSLAGDETLGILELLRVANSKGLTILEQAKWIDNLREVHGMSNSEIARGLEKSKAWVSVRVGMMGQMSPHVMERIMAGEFPAYSYLYTLRQFMRINSTPKEEVEEFVRSVCGKALSTRQIETLAHGYFKGPEELREQIKDGNVSWALGRMKESNAAAPQCSQIEQVMLRDLDITLKYMCRVISRSRDERYRGNAFHAQANPLTGGLLRNVELFSKAVKELHDRSGQAKGDLPPP